MFNIIYNFVTIFRLIFYIAINNDLKIIHICKKQLEFDRSHFNSQKDRITLSFPIRRVLSKRYSSYIRKIIDNEDPSKIINNRAIIREWLCNNLILYRKHEFNNIYKLSLDIFLAYLYLGKREKGIKYLEKLYFFYPQNKKLKELLKIQKTILKFEKENNIEDIWIVKAYPEKYPGHYQAYIKFYKNDNF